ncbi:MAG: 5-amino-6-(D-ribitylamino)uracil--L-tyrosine 4-hydroxyphenyl transferase CofH [Methanotrichaceae archaeon]
MFSEAQESTIFEGEFLSNDSIDYAGLISLWRQPLRLFHLANTLREKTCGDEVSFVVNRNVNFTNRCVGDCKFCAFRRSDGYMLTDEQILERVQEAEEFGATEICLQGGLAPGMVLEDYCHMLELIKRSYPRMHLHAYSPMEVFYMSKNSGVRFEEAISDLKKTGLGSMPGTAAEILVDRVRQQICPSKLSTEQWREVVTTAHKLGVPSTSTMLYGHVESFRDRIEHLKVLRQIQAETRGFTEFVLLPFMSENNDLGPFAQKMTILDHLKMHALARVALYPLITNIQASWVKLGRDMAGRSTWWGVNDLGGTLMEENISRTAGASETQCMTPDEFKELIEKNGRRPIQRTTLYDRVK